MKKLITAIVILTTSIAVSAQQLRIPFQLIDGKYMILKLPVIDSKDSLTLFFDTGAGTILLDNSAAEKFGFKSDSEVEVGGASGSASFKRSTNQRIYLGNNLFLDSVSIVQNDISAFVSALGFGYDGIIGTDIMDQYLTEIDFEKKIMTLYSYDEAISKKGYDAIPFIIKGNKNVPEFPITVKMANGEMLSGDVFFDSGAGLSLYFNTPFKEKHNLTQKIGKTFTVSNLGITGTSSEMSSGYIKSLQMGTFTFNTIPVNLSSDKAGVSSYEGYLGILGIDVLNRFNMILDYKEKKIYLKPNTTFSNEFRFSRSPFNLKFSGKDIVVSGVNEDSDAYKSGLRKGHKILSINGKRSSKIKSLNDAMGVETGKVKIQYLDGNNKKKTLETVVEVG